MLEYGNVGMMGRRNTSSGGPRFVVAGRDGARPSSGGLLPIFHHSIIPLQSYSLRSFPSEGKGGRAVSALIQWRDAVATLWDSYSLGDKRTVNRRLPNSEPQNVEVILSPLHDSIFIIRQSAVSRISDAKKILTG
jgi:hypothetical protein